MAVKQTAGRTQLGEFAPKFAELNDDVLFGEVWSREEQLSLRDRSLVTVVALMAQGLTDESFKYHLQGAKANGITKEEIAEIVTHAAFYCGWPKAWAVFRMAKEVWNEEKQGSINKYKIYIERKKNMLENTYTLENGIKIPKLGLGTWFIDDSKVAEVVREAVKIGYRMIDTAQAYGNEVICCEVQMSDFPNSVVQRKPPSASQMQAFDSRDIRQIDTPACQLGSLFADITQHRRLAHLW